MKSIPLHICDWDKIYLNRLNGFIQQQEHSPFLIRTYTDFAKACSDTSDKSMLIISSRMLLTDECDLKQQDAFNAWKHIVIMDENGDGRTWLSDMQKHGQGAYHIIEKYQSARDVFGYLIKICGDDACLSTNSNYVELITQRCITGVYTPEDKGLLHHFAMDLAKEEADKGKCLFISFEECVPENRDLGSLSDVICLIKEKDSDVTSKIENYIVGENGFDQILPPTCPYDLKEVSDGEWCAFLSDLEKKHIYERIIIDFGNQLPGLDLLNMCSKIILPCSLETKAKCERFKQLLIFMGKDLVCKKTEIVVVKGE